MKKIVIGCVIVTLLIGVGAYVFVSNKKPEDIPAVVVISPIPSREPSKDLAAVTLTATPEPTLSPTDGEDVPVVIPTAIPLDVELSSSQTSEETITIDTTQYVTTELPVSVSPTPTNFPTIEKISTAIASPTSKPIPTQKPISSPKPTSVPVSNNLSAGQFAKIILDKLNIPLSDNSEQTAYNTALAYGFITNESFSSMSAEVYRKNAFVVLKKVAEYLNVTVDSNVVSCIKTQKRISDISGTTAEKEAMYYVLATGIAEGKSNGAYSTNRKFEPKSKLSSTDAVTYAERIVDSSKRVKVSPDGQIIRKTKLPKFAKYYPYILESYPNEYYDWEFQFMKGYSIVDGVDTLNFTNPVYKDGKQYFSPSRMRSMDYLWGEEGYTTEEFIAKNSKIWEEQVRKHLKLIFNVNYKTTPYNKVWYNALLKTDHYYNVSIFGTDMEKKTRELLDEYLKDMKKNKTIIKAGKIAVDFSTLYQDDLGNVFVRVYVHYNIVSGTKFKQDWYSPLFFSNNSATNVSNVKLNQWRNGYFDVKLDIENYTGASGIVEEVVISDYYYTDRRVK